MIKSKNENEEKPFVSQFSYEKLNQSIDVNHKHCVRWTDVDFWPELEQAIEKEEDDDEDEKQCKRGASNRRIVLAKLQAPLVYSLSHTNTQQYSKQ